MWHYTLLSGLLIFILTRPGSAAYSVTADLHHPATLTCTWTCPGLLWWSVFNKPGSVLAQCDQTSCWSEEGFNISHSQYLNGSPYLTITTADYNKRGLYTCTCKGTDICKISLFIQSFNFTRQSHPGDSLTVDLPISERMKVVFNRRGSGTDGDDRGDGDDDDDDGNQSSVTLCTVEGCKVDCVPDYENRVFFRSSLTLTDLTQNDSGIYTLWDADNHEIISTHTLSVTGTITTSVSEGEQAHTSGENPDSRLVVGGMFCLGLVIGIFLHIFIWPWILRVWDQIMRKCCCRSPEDDGAESSQLKSVTAKNISNE